MTPPIDYAIPMRVTRARRRRRRRFAVVLCGALAIIGLLIGGTQ